MHLFERNSKLGFPVIVDPLTENFQNLCSMIAADREDERKAEFLSIALI